MLRLRAICRIVSGVLQPVLAKHTKSFNLIDTLSVGVDRIQRDFEPMRRQVVSWRQAQITDEQAKLILYSAFVEGKLDAPKGLRRMPSGCTLQPEYSEFDAETMWSLSNAFTSGFKKLDAIPQFKATAKWLVRDQASSLMGVSDKKSTSSVGRYNRSL